MKKARENKNLIKTFFLHKIRASFSQLREKRGGSDGELNILDDEKCLQRNSDKFLQNEFV